MPAKPRRDILRATPLTKCTTFVAHLVALQERREVGYAVRQHVHGGVAVAGDGVDAQVLNVGATNPALRRAQVNMELRRSSLITSLSVSAIVSTVEHMQDSVPLERTAWKCSSLRNMADVRGLDITCRCMSGCRLA